MFVAGCPNENPGATVDAIPPGALKLNPVELLVVDGWDPNEKVPGFAALAVAFVWLLAFSEKPPNPEDVG